MSPYGDTVPSSAIMAPSPALRHLAATVRGRRQDLGLTQEQLAALAGVSRPWLSELEGGKASAEIGLVLRVVDALGLRMELRAPDVADAVSERQPVDLDALLDDYEADGDAPSGGGDARSDGSRDGHPDASDDPQAGRAHGDA